MPLVSAPQPDNGEQPFVDLDDRFQPVFLIPSRPLVHGRPAIEPEGRVREIEPALFHCFLALVRIPRELRGGL